MKFDVRTVIALVIIWFAVQGLAPGVLTPTGPVTVYVAFEEDSKYMTTEFADLRTDIMTGEVGKPFKDKGDKFLFIDNDTDNALVKSFAPYKDEVPEAIVIAKDGSAKHRLPLTYKTSAEEFSTLLKEKGL